jgi:DNA-binding LacI/PurR family transcriptional regulator
VAFIGARRGRSEPAQLRARGWWEEPTRSGLPADDGLVAATDGWVHADGAAAMTGLLDAGRRPDAVFAYNDLMAIGAMRVLDEHGLRIPEDVVVAGFDDVVEGHFGAVTLTSVSPDKEAIGRLAVEWVPARLTGDAPEPRRITPVYRLAERESTRGRGATPAVSRS